MNSRPQEPAQEPELSSINSLPSSLLHAVFSSLGPKDLCNVSATCTCWSRLTRDKASNNTWKKFYTSRWRVTGAAGEDVCWQSKYGSKMKQGKSWAGKYEHDSLYGHKAGIKSLKLLPSHGMLLSGSLDRTVRLWDLHYGMPVSISRPHGGTVRSVCLDQHLVASGSSDNVIRLWHARGATAGASFLDPAIASDTAALVQDGVHGLGLAEDLMEMDGPADDDVLPAGHLSAAVLAGVAGSSAATAGGVPVTHGPYSVVTGEADESLFDLSLPAQQLRGHIGPVTSLCLTDTCLYSGSWDYTVRCWRRGSWDCISVLKYQDWVWSVVARGGMLLVANGPEVHVHDLPTGKLLRKFQNLHEGTVSCLEGTYNGKLLFTGGTDGLLMAHDLRMKDPSRVLWHHNAGVHGLALEDPWLVSAASDGTVVMHNLEAAVPNNISTCGVANGHSSSMARRSLSCPGHGGGPMYCVDIAESWLAAGGESPTIRMWDFTKGAEAAARAAAARAARNNAKRAKQRKAADAAKASKRGGSHAGSSSSRGHVGGAANCSEAAQTAVPAPVLTECTSRTSSAAAGSGVERGTCIDSSSGRDKKTHGLLSAAAAAAKSAGSASCSGTAQAIASGGSSRYYRMQLNTRQQQAASSPSSSAAMHDRSQSSRASQQTHCRKGYNGYSQSAYMHFAACSSPSDTGSYSSSPQFRHQQWWAPGSSPQQQWQAYGVSPPGRWQPHSSKPKWHPANGVQQQQRGNGNGHTSAQIQQGSRAAAGTTRDDAVRGIPVPKHRYPGSRVNRQLPSVAGHPGASPDTSGSPNAAVGDISYRVPYSSSYPSATRTGPWLVTGSSPRYDATVGRSVCTGSQGAGPSRSRLSSSVVDHQVDTDGESAPPGL